MDTMDKSDKKSLDDLCISYKSFFNEYFKSNDLVPKYHHTFIPEDCFYEISKIESVKGLFGKTRKSYIPVIEVKSHPEFYINHSSLPCEGLSLEVIDPQYSGLVEKFTTEVKNKYETKFLEIESKYI